MLSSLLELEGLRRRVQVRPFLVGRILVHVRSVVSRANGYRDTTQNSVRIYLNDDFQTCLRDVVNSLYFQPDFCIFFFL